MAPLRLVNSVGAEAEEGPVPIYKWTSHDKTMALLTLSNVVIAFSLLMLAVSGKGLRKS